MTPQTFGWLHPEPSQVRCGCKPKRDEIVQYLAAADRYTYMHCLQSTNESDGGASIIDLTTWPEMDYALGTPDGPAVEEPHPGSGIWRRRFASGAWVLWDNNEGAKNGSYFFPGKPPPPGPAPSPSPGPSPGPAPPPSPPPLPASCGKLLVDTGAGGDDVAPVTVRASAAACCAWCIAAPACDLWAWHRESGGRCHLHGAGARVHKVKGCDVGIVVRGRGMAYSDAVLVSK